MQEGRDPVKNVTDAICDGLRQIGDFSYAIMPRDLAHSVGDLKKALLSSFRGALEREIEWIDDRVAGGDRMREEWREKCRRTSADATSQSGV